VCTSSKGDLAQLGEEEKGLECIFPAKQGLQTGSGLCDELSTIPVTIFVLSIFLTAV